MQIPIHTNAKTYTNAHTNPVCRSGMYTPYRSPTFTCPTRQAKTPTGSAGRVVVSLSRPTPYGNPPYRYRYQSGSAPHTTPLSSACVPPHLPLSSKVRGRCFGFAPSYRTGLTLSVWSRALTIRYPHGLRLRLARVDESAPRQPVRRKTNRKKRSLRALNNSLTRGQNTHATTNA